MTTLLQIYLCIGLVYSASVVTVAEVMRRPHVVALPLRLRLRIHVTVLALGALIWPLAFLRDHSRGS